MRADLIGVVEDGDIISINIPENRIELKVDRGGARGTNERILYPRRKELTGYLKRYAELVSGGASGAISELIWNRREDLKITALSQRLA